MRLTRFVAGTALRSLTEAYFAVQPVMLIRPERISFSDTSALPNR